jgi:hypothetical protein
LIYHTCDRADDDEQDTARLDEIETLADDLEDALYTAINAFATDHPGLAFNVVYEAVRSLAIAYEKRIIGYDLHPTGEDPVLNAHLDVIEALDSGDRQTFQQQTKALFDSLHKATLQFGKEHPTSCLCVVHQGTRGLVHTVSLNLVEPDSTEA